MSDVNPRDYRAWYGLGQTYELLGMPHFAVQYYNKATALRYEFRFSFLSSRFIRSERKIVVCNDLNRVLIES